MINEYSKALFELSNEKNLEFILECFDVFMSNFKDDFKKILLSPKIVKEEKKKVITTCFKNFEKDFLNFLLVVIDNSRVDMFDEIYKDFKSLYDDLNNIVHIDVYSFDKLDEESYGEINNKLSSKFSGKTIVLNNVIDSTLVGGVKLFYNGKQIDVTLKNQLEMLKANL